MKLNKKGFTLVELLAVIVVLAIIALVGYTVVGDVISTSQVKTDKTSITNFAKAISNTVLMYNVDVTKGIDSSRINNTITSSESLNNLNLKASAADASYTGSVANVYSGDKITCQKIEVTSGGVVQLTKCYAGDRSTKTYSYANNTLTED